MPEGPERKQAVREPAPAVQREAVPPGEVPAESESPVADGALLASGRAMPHSLAVALAHADMPMRASLVGRLQRERGNGFVRQLVARQQASATEATIPPAIQRDLPPGGAPAPTPTPAAAPAPAAQPQATPADQAAAAQAELSRQMIYTATILRQTKPLDPQEKQKLDGFFQKAPTYQLILERNEKREKIDEVNKRIVERNQQITPDTPPPSPRELQGYELEIKVYEEAIKDLQQRIDADLAKLHVRNEEEFLEMMEKQFPEMWEKRAIEITNVMLDENQSVAETEKRHYGADVLSPNVQDLREADSMLFEVYDSLNRQIAEADTLNRSIKDDQVSLPGGVPPPEDTKRLEDLNKRIAAERVELQEKHDYYGTLHPILMSEEYVPGSLYRASPEKIEELTGGWVQKILDNIQDTRKNINDRTIRVWDLRDVPEITYQSLGIPRTSVLRNAVNTYIADKKSDQAKLEVALAAVQVTATIVATVASGGMLAPLAAGIATGVTLGQLALHAQQYMAQSAAQKVSLDPAVGQILTDEPTLGWLVMDVISLGLDVSAVVGALKSSARVMMATGDTAAFAAAARKAAPSAAEDLILRASRQVAARPGSAAVGIYRTWGQEEMLTVFTRAFRRPGPGADAYRVHKTIEEFAEAWHAHPGVGALDPVPLGFVDVENGIIHLPPSADVVTIFHETMHWAGAQSGTRAIMGTFLEEGMAEWLTIRTFGPGAESAYVRNTGFVQILSERIGADVLEQAYLHGQWGGLRSALQSYFKSAAKTEKFYQTLRQIGANAENEGKLSEAMSMLLQGPRAKL